MSNGIGKNEKEWLCKFAGVRATESGESVGTDNVENFLIDQAQKEAVLNAYRKDIKDLSKGLSEAWVGVKGSKGKSLLKVDGTSIDEVDFTEIDWKILGETMKKNSVEIHKLTHKLIAIDMELGAIKSEVREGKPLFTKEELAAELWTPLVRARLLPETFVPDGYSEVQKMLDETNALYRKRVSEYKEQGKLTPPINRTALYGKAALKLASTGIDLATEFGADGAKKGLELAGKILEVTETSFDFVLELKDDIKDAVEGDASLKDTLGKIGNSLHSFAGDIISSELGKEIVGKIGGNLTGKEKENFGKMVKNATRVFNGSKFAVGVTKAVAHKSTDELKTAVIAAFKDALGDDFAGELAGKIGGIPVVKELEDFAKSSANKLKSAGQSKDSEKEKDEKDDAFDVDEFLNGLKDYLKGTVSTVSDLKKYLADADAIDVKGTKEEEEEANAFKKFMESGGEGAATIGAASIDNRIKQLERDKKIVDTAFSIVEGGIDLAKKLFAPLGMLSTAVQLIKNMNQARKHVEAIIAWRSSTKNLADAQSELTSSSQNFLVNQTGEFTHNTIKTLLDAAKIVGEALQTAGLVATATGVGATVGTGLEVAGKIVEKTAEAGLTLEEEIYKIVKKEAIETAWRATAEALSNPKNRRLGLVARLKNPTLAKYSIAWGALVKNDPIAKDAMRKCGLNRASLASADKDVNKVVDYLQTLYEEDNEVYREYKGFLSWLPDSPSISVKTWLTITKGASDPKSGCKGKLKQLPNEFTNIASLFFAFESVLTKTGTEDFETFKEKLFVDLSTKKIERVGEARKHAQEFLKIVTELGKKLEEKPFKPSEVVKDNEGGIRAAVALNGLFETLAADCKSIHDDCNALETSIEEALKSLSTQTSSPFEGAKGGAKRSTTPPPKK
ncbi:MAG: hypothetical protein LBS59_02795 [Puniceicoccales bacterium]|jgi:hypothetical protein|nr:hypothetical protein [Puniceicoccales bacterium]